MSTCSSWIRVRQTSSREASPYEWAMSHIWHIYIYTYIYIERDLYRDINIYMSTCSSWIRARQASSREASPRRIHPNIYCEKFSKVSCEVIFHSIFSHTLTVWEFEQQDIPQTHPSKHLWREFLKSHFLYRKSVMSWRFENSSQETSLRRIPQGNTRAHRHIHTHAHTHTHTHTREYLPAALPAANTH